MKAFKIWLTEKFFGKLWRALRVQMAEGVVAGAGGVALLGDSITHFGKWDILLPDARISNFGIGGERTAHLLERLDPVVKLAPRKLFLLIGTNDLGIGFTVDEVAANMDRLIAELKGRLPQCEIHLQTVMPRKRKFAPDIRALNERYKAIAKRHGVNLVDLFPVFDDGTGEIRADLTYDVLHLNGAGYLAWRDVLAPLLSPAVTAIGKRAEG